MRNKVHHRTKLLPNELWKLHAFVNLPPKMKEAPEFSVL